MNVKHLKKVAIAIIIISAIAIFHFLSNKIIYPVPPDSQALTEMVININQNCPVMIDAVTRLDSASLPNKKAINYYYSIIQTTTNEIDIISFEKSLYTRLLISIKETNEMELLRTNETTFGYFYYDKDGTLISKFIITPENYSK